MTPVSMILSDPFLDYRSQVTIDALDVLCAQLTRDLLRYLSYCFSYAPTRPDWQAVEALLIYFRRKQKLA